jgi:Flp pilus assembly protein TadD
MAQPLVTFDAREAKWRIVLAVALLFAVAFVWFAVRWQIGSMMAELTSPNQPDSTYVAELAEDLAPADPMATWLLATKTKEDFSAESIERSVSLFEKVVRLAPNDFRWWIELGRAYEQAEQPAKAEAAFRRAVELAPTYTFPHWQFGNFYLRQGRSDEAFAELKKTTEQSVVYREQVFSLAWDYFDKDPQKLESIIDDAPDVRATLALFYAVRGSADNALRVWDTLSDEQKVPHVEAAKNIAQGLFEKHSFRQAVAFARQTGMDPDSQPEAVTNGGFEKFIGSGERSLFSWQIYRGDPRLDISSDSSVKAEGQKSLRLTFKGYVKPELHNVVQFVAAEPGARYRLGFSLRTENLRSAGPPMQQVVAGPAAAILGSTQMFATGTQEWTSLSIEFTVPADADGFAIRTVRGSCGDECPIVGTMWYDDFKLTKL